MKKNTLVALLAGSIFGAGLVVSGLSDSARVRAFLDVTGAWDPRLLWVMASAVAVFAVAFAYGKRRNLAALRALPQNTGIDARLVAGAVLFGIGWGIAGYCPGPAIVSFGAALTRLDFTPMLFVGAMIAGMLLHARFGRALLRGREDA